MGRRLRTSVPISPQLLESVIPDKQLVRENKKRRAAQKKHYDKRDGVRTLSELRRGDRVWITDQKQPGTIVKKSTQPRSYLVKNQNGQIRQKIFNLVEMFATPGASSSEVCYKHRKKQKSSDDTVIDVR